MERNKFILFLIVMIIGMIVVEGSNRTFYPKRIIKKKLTSKTIKKDLKTLKKQEGALKLVDGDRGIFEGIFYVFFL